MNIIAIGISAGTLCVSFIFEYEKMLHYEMLASYVIRILKYNVATLFKDKLSNIILYISVHCSIHIS